MHNHMVIYRSTGAVVKRDRAVVGAVFEAGGVSSPGRSTRNWREGRAAGFDGAPVPALAPALLAAQWASLEEVS